MPTICARCGTVQRRETAKFCQQCGAGIEPAVDDQPDNAATPTTESVSQQAQSFKPTTLLAHESESGDRAEDQPAESIQPASPGFMADTRTEREHYADVPTLKTPAVTSPGQAAPTIDQPAPRPAVVYSTWQEPPAPMRAQQTGRQHPERAARGIRPQSSAWPEARALARLDEALGAWRVGAAASEADILPERPQQEFAGDRQHAATRAQALGDSQPPTTQNRRINPPRASLEINDEVQAAIPAVSAERRPRSTARGPVPGALSRPRRTRRRRLPLGIAITIGLLLVFVLAGLGIYAIATGSASPEPSAFLTYTDPGTLALPGRHFSIQYPNVWTIQKPTNGANGVRFTDATDTAELWVTYTASSSNLTVAQFADQEAANVGIATPAPDMDTFAGATWVVRSGVVTQTSGISQQILLYVTLHNNLLFEIRKVAPLNSYAEPNQAAFIPMLQSLTLM